MLRHERACDAANKTTKKRRSFGLEEVHPGEPYGRPNSPQSPKNKQTASACLIGHIWGFVAASAAVVCRAFLRRRLTALLADRTGSTSSASGPTRPRHSLSISNARVATAPLANPLALGRRGEAFSPALSGRCQSAEDRLFSELPQRSHARLRFVVLWAYRAIWRFRHKLKCRA
jgi:hypothetical protein